MKSEQFIMNQWLLAFLPKSKQKYPIYETKYFE